MRLGVLAMESLASMPGLATNESRNRKASRQDRCGRALMFMLSLVGGSTSREPRRRKHQGENPAQMMLRSAPCPAPWFPHWALALLGIA